MPRLPLVARIALWLPIVVGGCATGVVWYVRHDLLLAATQAALGILCALALRWVAHQLARLEARLHRWAHARFGVTP